MSIDGQVLVVAFLAISLKLLLWAREADGVDVEDRLRRKAVSHLRLRAQAHSARAVQERR